MSDQIRVLVVDEPSPAFRAFQERMLADIARGLGVRASTQFRRKGSPATAFACALADLRDFGAPAPTHGFPVSPR